MSDDTTIRQNLSALLSGCAGATNRLIDYILEMVQVDILEMEDVLFHHNSAVLMPERPEGESSEEDDTAQAPGDENEEQDQVTGLRVLALVFREFEFDERKEMLIAGHTDTSGSAEYNFELSKMRADNVKHLLAGEVEEWSHVCFNKHKVEDYQQILTYINDQSTEWKSTNWDCAPQGIDDDWGPNTKRAVNNFAVNYNVEYAEPRGLELLPDNLGDIINADSQHRWPEDHWHGIFRIYEQVIADTLGVTTLALEQEHRPRLRYV
ncbi:OmpA family protein, partial [candidate division GN15 bacterium]|nr:OmpA family protein [candidate division GN15 bacterium]